MTKWQSAILPLVLLCACTTTRSATRNVEPLPGNPQPVYPETLTDSGAVGEVVAEAVVDTSGAVVPQSIKIVQSAHPLLDRAVVGTFARWRFNPAMQNGQPVAQLVRIPFTFKVRPPTSGECRVILARADSAARTQSGKRLGFDQARALSPITMVLPSKRRSGQTRIVAEFDVDTAGDAVGGTLRIIESSVPVDEATRDLDRVMHRWRFEPARVRGCAFRTLARQEVVY